MIAAITGPHRTLTHPEMSYVQNSMIDYAFVVADVDTWVSGCAYGVDTVGALAAYQCFPGAVHNLCVPLGKRHNQTLVKLLERYDDVIVNEITGGYMARNDFMVSLAEVLLAFPETLDEVQRSGTWATIRRARNAGVPVLYYPLNAA